MPIRKESEIIASIKERKHIVNGKEYTVYDAYAGSNLITKKPIRVISSDREELLNKIHKLCVESKEGGDLATALTANQLMDAKLAIHMLHEANIDISLLDCARHEIERIKSVSAKDRKIGEAYAEYITSKKDGADKMKTEATTGKWVLKSGGNSMLSEITMESILEYMKTEYGSMAPKTYNSHLSYIKTFLNWCCKDEQRYMLSNPAAKLTLKEVEWKTPEYFKPDVVERIFRILEERKREHPEYLATAILGFFCGIRSEEIRRMASDDDAATILLDDETIRIAKGKGFTKGRKPRAFNIPPNAIEWMRSFDFMSAVSLIRKFTSDTMIKMLDQCGIKWTHNAARHTFITMHVAAYGEPMKTQAMCGTSGTMLCNNYNGLASKKEGEAYFAILPCRRDF